MIDSNVTFPDEYPNNPDLAGKEVVFTFTVNSIQKEVTMDTMDDEFASKQFGADSVDGVYNRYASIWSPAQRALIKMIFIPLWRIIC